MFNPNESLGIIAGCGDLPKEVIKSCEAIGCEYTVFSLSKNFKGNYKFDYKFNIGQSSRIFSKLHELKIKNIIMVGKVNRPNISDLRLDFRTLNFILRAIIMSFKFKSVIGDDYLLRMVISEIEKDGINIIGVEEILTDYFFSHGLFTNHSPTDKEKEEINIGLKASKRLGKNDIGQSVVINNGLVIGEEDYKGTDYLINNLDYDYEASYNPILIKTVKPNQDRRVDLPVIGSKTIDLCIEKGFRGIVIEANGTLINDKKYVIKKCNDHGLFLMSVNCS
ncbi:MAG: UDP-2,3-diacylglucosamine diphosphatase LpxI [Pseudomonadota bacterium]|nr:UDP-2,3-diacylglucosamine diphosphatase LpxI [Pseudomonadota bacterium]